MTQEQLNQVFEDLCTHGRQVQGWSCDQQTDRHVLTDTKRGESWERSAADGVWQARG